MTDNLAPALDISPGQPSTSVHDRRGWGAVMTSLPVAKAGVGSAVNDTAREVGGALGIAVLGSIVASGFAGNLAGATAGLPNESAELARGSVGAALQVAASLGGGTGAALADAARIAYTDAMGVALLVAAGVALAAVAVVLRYLPQHREITTHTDIIPSMPIQLDTAPVGAGRKDS